MAYTVGENPAWDILIYYLFTHAASGVLKPVKCLREGVCKYEMI